MSFFHRRPFHVMVGVALTMVLPCMKKIVRKARTSVNKAGEFYLIGSYRSYAVLYMKLKHTQRISPHWAEIALALIKRRLHSSYTDDAFANIE